MSEPKRTKMVAAPKTEPAATETPATKERRKKTTLAERGPLLPIGVNLGSGFVRDMAHRPWKTKDERELGKLKRPKMNMAQYVTTVLAHLYTKVGPHVFTEDVKMDERRIKLGQMYMPDIFYMYIWLRMNVIGEQLKMDLTCPKPNCAKKFAFTGELGTLDVYTADDVNDLYSYYTLKDPIEVRRQTVEKVRLGPATWVTLETSAGDINNDAIGKIIAVKGSICGLNDDPTPVQLADVEVDELSKRDLEALVNVVNQDFFGAKMAVEGNCPACEEAFAVAIDWRHDSFFSISSQ